MSQTGIEAAGSRLAPTTNREQHRDAESSFALIGRAQAGDEMALNELCVRYLPRLQRWAHGRLPPSARSAHDTFDLMQDALIQVVQRIHMFYPRHEGAFQAYVRHALLNRIRDLARQEKRRGQAVPFDTPHASADPSPCDEAIGSEFLERYEAALARLRPSDRQAITARVELNLSDVDAAAALGKPSAAAARMAVSRALVRLAQEMARESAH
jgi:RNA polymerase sigma-70 factor, ECF subfamily